MPAVRERLPICANAESKVESSKVRGTLCAFDRQNMLLSAIKARGEGRNESDEINRGRMPMYVGR